jgi:hypothetical protein
MLDSRFFPCALLVEPALAVCGIAIGIKRGGPIGNPTARRAFRAALALDATARHRRKKPSGLYCRWRSDIVVSLKLGLASQKKGHGRPGRMETGPPARTLPIGTQEHADTHRRSACAQLQKHSAFGITK